MYCAHTALGCSVNIYNLYKRILLLLFFSWIWAPRSGCSNDGLFFTTEDQNEVGSWCDTLWCDTQCRPRSWRHRYRLSAGQAMAALAVVFLQPSNIFIFYTPTAGEMASCASIAVDRILDAYSPWLQGEKSGILPLFTHPKAAVGRISIYTIKWVSGSLLLCVGLVGLFCSHLTIYECH